MVTTTTQYSFQKPTVGDDEDAWGGYLNSNFDSIDSLLRGATSLSSLSLTGNITFGDNDKAIFGAGSDLQIYHTGATSIIKEGGTGDLLVQAQNFYVQNVAGTQSNFYSIDGGATGLAYAGAVKLATTSTGVDITGNIAVSGTVDGRDVAADGTKLDGIESGATADQTKADIDALGINAATLDSLDSTQFLRSDADDTATGKITLAKGGFADQLEVKRGDGDYYSVIQYSNSSRQLGKLGFTQTGALIARPLTASTDSTVWHSGNDGSGSGLDADTTDGYQASESSTASTLAARTSGGDLYMRYGISTYLNMTHTAYQRDADTIFYSSGDNYLRKNNATGFKNSLGLGTGDSPTFSNVSISGVLYHDGDLDTNLTFTDNTITLNAGGSAEVTVTSTGVQLGDTGNGYFQPVSGHFGSIQIDGGAHNGYEGYSIGGRAVFMHDNANATGIYDDVNNYWMFYGVHGAGTYMYYNGAQKFNTTSTGANINGDLNAVDNVYVAGNIYHEGDTDTYVGFATDTINVYAGNVHAAQIDGNGLFLPNGSLREDYDALSGTTPTCNVNSGGAFSLTMSDNTTFTFTSPTSGYSTGFILQLTGHASTAYTVDFGTNNNVKWAGGTAPDAPAAGETDIYVFWTRDGGTTWYGVLSVDAAA